ncbi:FkbM family methyltransferase [Pelagibacterales bacterium SAG-MED38]|nr:FkbM family methyltransferase [Pelagibacterales bacterium SAG-MED38]
MTKKFLQKIINFFGYKISKLNKKKLNIDQIIQNNLPNNPIIFDIGANKGQSIEKFSKLSIAPQIHSFEPLRKEYEILKKKFNKENIFLNNCAVGNLNEKRKFNISIKSDSSSFYNINKNTDWIKKRSSEHNVSESEYANNTVTVDVVTIDDYVLKNKINKIDLLKIDTECHEDKVLEGALNTIKNIPVNIVMLELRLDNVYDKYLTFSEIEKYLSPKEYRLVSINLLNDNLFSGLVFAADIMYFSKKKFKI